MLDSGEVNPEESSMIGRSNEIIKQLNRLVNDRSLAPKVRNQISGAAQHIKHLHETIKLMDDLHLNLSKNQGNISTEWGRRK